MLSLKTNWPFAVMLSIILSACATPDTDYPEFTRAEIAAGTVEAQRASIEAYLALEQRVDNIAWPLLVGNADLCHERTREAADLAGVKPGARPVRIGDEEIDASMETLFKAVNAYKDSQKDGDERAPLSAVFEQDGRLHEVEMSMETFCDIPVSVASTDVINASASGSSVRIYRGLLNYFPDNDEAIGVIVGHEIGHVIGRHVPKQRRNSMVSGFALWGLPVTLGASLVDSLIAGPLERWAGVETPPGAAGVARLTNRALGTRSFEQEADYLGLYIAARGGVDISNAEEVFKGFAKVSPRSTYGNRSHPVTPQRVLAVQATRAEIKAKQARAEALIPNGWPYPVALEGEDQ